MVVLYFAASVNLMANRHGLIVDVRTTHATGRAKRETAEAMIQAAARGRRAYRGAVRLDQGGRRAAQDRHRGIPRVGWMVTLTAAGCNLVRLPRLLAKAA